MKDYFPAKLATGDRFCNRTKEKKLLKNNIHKSRHSVLISPRRYGKSSLANKVVEEMSLPFVSVDLFVANDDATVSKRILQGIAEAVSQLLPPTEKFLNTVQKTFRHFKVTLGAKFFNIEATLDVALSSPVDQILNALTSLASLIKNKKQKLVFFIDEFQDIAIAENAKSIQGAIRHIAQTADEIVFLFSGSNRHLLSELFDNSNMPLYMLCDKLILQRIHSTDYWDYIQKPAQTRWKKELEEVTFNYIMRLTELHPFYINMLCNELWKNDTHPDIATVEQAWEECYQIEQRRLVAELDSLTVNQQNLMKALAVAPTKAPTGHPFVQRVKMANSSINQTLKILYQKDMIYTVQEIDKVVPEMEIGHVRVLDPLLAYALKKLN